MVAFEAPPGVLPAVSAKEQNMTRKTLVATAAAIFAAGTLATAAYGQAASVKCSGVNSCKGTSACKTASSSCKGQNSCKGLGWTEAANAAECTSKGGKVLQ